MDPTNQELAQIQVLQDALDWAGVQGDLSTMLTETMGTLERVREVPLITRPIWDAKVQALQVPGDPEPGQFGPPPLRPLTPVEQARIESFRRVCHLRVGREPDNPGDGNVLPPVGGALPFPGMGGPGAAMGLPFQTPLPASTRKLKLSAILDPTLEAEVQGLSPQEQTQMYETYRQKFGDFPDSSCDPSPDQLAALSQVIAAGAVPFACFTIFGPHGQRLLRRMTFTGFHLNIATGEWARREQAGPSSYHEWYKCWRVYRTAMLLLQAADAERLDNYSEMIRQQVTQFGDEAWFLVAKADARMRSEHLDRLRRQLRINPEYGFTENSPWSACYAMATKDHQFWTQELSTPATLFLSRNKRLDAAKDEKDGPDSPSKKPRQSNRPARRGYQGEDKSEKDDQGLFIKNRKGIEVCRNYNANRCGSSAAQGRCKQKRSHQCNKCLGPHQAVGCTGKNAGS